MSKQYQPRKLIILFGDSLTQAAFSTGGWASGLSDYYIRKADLLNRGYSGYNTTQALCLLNRELANDRFPFNQSGQALVTIFFGANDASLEGVGPEQHVEIAEYHRNLSQIIDALNTRYAILITPPPVDEITLDRCSKEYGFPPGTRTNEHTGLYAAECLKVAREKNLPCLDLWTEFQTHYPHEQWKRLFSDGLHFEISGNQLVLELLKETIEKYYPEWSPNHLPLDAPLWGEVDFEE